MMNKEVQDSLKQVGIRMVEEPPLLSPEPMDNPEAAVRVLGEWLSEMDRELFCVVNLNSHLTPINMNVVSMGTLNTVYVNPRETMKSAILSNAAYLMLVHNHPSGSLNPSREDITITDRIQNAASIMVFLFWIILLLEEIRSSSLFGKTMFSHIQMISSMCPTCQNYNGHNK